MTLLTNHQSLLICINFILPITQLALSHEIFSAQHFMHGSGNHLEPDYEFKGRSSFNQPMCGKINKTEQIPYYKQKT